MRQAIALAAALLAGCGGSGGGGDSKEEEPDPHINEVFLQVRNACHDGVTQLYFCWCPQNSWTRIDLPDAYYASGMKPYLGRYAIVDVGWVPVGNYAFLWRTENNWQDAYEPIPPDLPPLPFEWDTWNGRECREVRRVLSLDPHGDVPDMFQLQLTCPDM